MFARGEARGFSPMTSDSKLDGEMVTVEHRSTRCGNNAAMPCPKSAAPGVEVYVDSGSIIIDFSNVQEPGVFEDADFEGFVIELAAESGTPIQIARIDTDATNMEVRREDLAHDAYHLDVNLAGRSYDSDSFVKIDLLVGALNLLRQGE